MEVDDATEVDDDGGDGTQVFLVPDIPHAGPDPGLIPQPPGEDESPIEVGDEEGVEEVGAGTGTVEEEGAAHAEEEGAGRVEEEEEAGTDAGDGADGPGDTEETAQGGRYNLWPNRSRVYFHLFDSQTYNVTNVHVPYKNKTEITTAQRVFRFMFTQMSARAGIKKHGQAARDALMAEFAQLDYKGAYEPIRADDLTKTQQSNSLRIINLIKEKRNRRLKGRLVADGRPQRMYYTKDKISSPTTTPESVLLTALIDAVEERHVVVADVTGTYLNTDMDNFVLI